MKTRRRLTREESKEVTRTRLIEAAERLFIRKGFDGASVEEISEAAGYSRGGFYSKDFIALRMEFSRGATRDRAVRKHLSELLRRELETFAGPLGDRSEVVALVLLAVAHGLGHLAIETEPAPKSLTQDGNQC